MWRGDQRGRAFPVKVFRFDHSCFCLKVEKALDLVGTSFERVQVPYLNRAELAQLTGGYIQVPVVVTDSGQVLVDSRTICEFLVAGPEGERLVPKGSEAVIWAYHDWCDHQLEDVLFRLVAPLVLRKIQSVEEKSFYTFIKERKFGKGCIARWETTSDELLRRGRELLAPTQATLRDQAFIVCDDPTLADAALYGQVAMLAEAGRDIERDLGPVFLRWFESMQASRESVMCP
jgi:glutathione S-transferase